MILETILIILAFIFVLVGIAGVLFPLLPGVPLAWLGLLIFGFATDFSVISLKTVLIFLLLSFAVSALDFIIPLLGAQKYKASRQGLIGAGIGVVAGIFIGGPFGMTIGACLGLIMGEMYGGRQSQEISHVLRGAFIGFLFNGFIKLALSVAMLAYLIVSLFKI